MKKQVFVILMILFIPVILLIHCAQKPESSLYDPNFKVEKPDPIITAVEPESGVYSGIGEVTIIGQNFSSNQAEVHVYFDGAKATLVSTSNTQIDVIAPVVAGDSVKILVRIDGAISFGEYFPYKVEIAVREYGGITNISDAFGVACDQNENLYVSQGDLRIVKVTPEEEQVDYVTTEEGVDGFYTTLRMGPGGKLYGIRTRFLYEVPAGGGDISRVTGRLKSRPTDFDFDSNYNIFYSSSSGIYLIRADFSDTLMMEYTNISISSLRVFNGYVYVAGQFTGSGTPEIRVGVWRNEIISAEGQLGDTQPVFNLEEYYGQLVGVPGISTITFAEDGDMYLGVDSTTISEAITVVHPSGDGIYLPENAEPLYEVLLIPPATTFCWGSDQYLYMNRRSNNPDEKRLLRLTMGKYSAPYYGRQ